MTTFSFAVVSPEKAVYDGPATQVNLRAAGGDIGVLAGHVPFIGAVGICPCEIVQEDGSQQVLAVHGGFLEVDPEGGVTLLADVVETADEIDVARASKAKEVATGQIGTDPEDLAAQFALMRAEVRLLVAGPS